MYIYIIKLFVNKITITSKDKTDARKLKGDIYLNLKH